MTPSDSYVALAVAVVERALLDLREWCPRQPVARTRFRRHKFVQRGLDRLEAAAFLEEFVRDPHNLWRRWLRSYERPLVRGIQECLDGRARGPARHPFRPHRIA